MLTIDLGAIAANYKMLRRARDAERMRRRGQGRRLRLRHRPGHRGARRAPAARHSSSRICPRRGACAPSRARRRSTCSTDFPHAAGQGFRRDRGAAGDQQPGRARRVGPFRLDQRLCRQRGAARRHRHEPARPHHRRGGGDRVPHPIGKPPHRAADEPPRLRRPAGASAERSADPAVPRNPLAVSRHLAVRSPTPPASSSTPRPIATWCAPASRSTAAIRRRANPIRCGR